MTFIDKQPQGKQTRRNVMNTFASWEAQTLLLLRNIKLADVQQELFKLAQKLLSNNS